MHTTGVATAYDRWAPIYDLVFGNVFAGGRREAIDAAERVGGAILEIGIGTGISLPLYRADSQVYGVDISDAMLDKARERVERLGLTSVREIARMDAEDLQYGDETFDVAVAQYVITAVPDPEKAMDELVRVTRPGGEIIITTRVGAGHGMRGKIEKALMPLTTRLGFRTDFPWARYENWASRNPQALLLEQRPLAPLGHFSLVRYRKLAGKPA
ncbi:class I SAM-dependent methyltransferase [Alteraurantiacibacter aquimixticola]|uniref:Class I SAM-dependent methyltransferase n=1 Tax=Alteraurantiacibacter aquimixticola TaxID=2489173 RepID=A0A4T3F786_9SPHN|nr:class I SAM-dependent methyltransferase [Alteraurantiacibacter aquimixticola]TIX50726.1 class I SAM-dependent methyltransferase [Alteraurantiacibacter aquimixticola]